MIQTKLNEKKLLLVDQTHDAETKLLFHLKSLTRLPQKTMQNANL